jgi:hypothetical protein
MIGVHEVFKARVAERKDCEAQGQGDEDDKNKLPGEGTVLFSIQVRRRNWSNKGGHFYGLDGNFVVQTQLFRVFEGIDGKEFGSEYRLIKDL